MWAWATDTRLALDQGCPPARTPARRVAWGQEVSGCQGHRSSSSLERGDACPGHTKPLGTQGSLVG